MKTGSPDSYIHRIFAEKHSFKIRSAVSEVALFETSVCVPIQCQCKTHVLAENNEYSDIRFNVLNGFSYRCDYP